MPSDSQPKNITELLSPAGDWDALTAAVTNGADAVYLGTKEFNARINARNFILEDLPKVTDYCHRAGVRVYLTMNIMLRNHEIKRFFSVMSQAYMAGIDGVIIQHVSFLDIIKSNYPGLAVFLSTQCAVSNAATASLFKSADRIVLPRELPIDEIRKIVDSGVKAEVFVHGALCFGYSGLCLFSSFVGDRSGNRGSCAQLCRQKYNNSYPLSTRELCTARRIPELIEAGITGFKVEGRMRSPLYVAVATRLYRKAIDSYLAGKFTVPEKELAEIEVVFNREFTEGLIFGDKQVTSPEKPMNRGALLGIMEDNEVVLQRTVAVGDGMGLWQDGNVSGAVVNHIMRDGQQTPAANVGDRVSLGFRAKDGVRVYVTSSPQISLKPDFVVNRPPIVLAKREVVEAVLPKVTLGGVKSISLSPTPLPSRERDWRAGSKPAPTVASLLVKVYSLNEAEQSLRIKADLVFYDIFAADFPEKPVVGFGAYLPRIMNDAELERAVDLLKRNKPAAILTGNLGLLKWRKEFPVPLFLDYSVNVWNDIDTLFFQKYDATPLLSPELSLDEMGKLQNKDAVIFCHGDLILMNTMIEVKDKRLVNEKGASFQVRKEDSYWQILNSRPFGLFNDIRVLRDAGFSKFLIDKAGQGARLTAMYRDLLDHEMPDRRLRKGHTSGHLYKPLP